MLRDLRYAARMLIKAPGFSLVAFLAIALGIGVNTTIFSVVNTLLLKPLPVGHSQQLVQLYTVDARIGKYPMSYLNFLDYAKQNEVCTGVAAYNFAAMGMTRAGETSNVIGLLVSGNYFDLLQVRPILGRAFAPDEDTTPNGHPVIVLSHRFWNKLGGDPSIVGSAITLNGKSFTIIGVAPPRFTGIDVGVAPDFFVPMAMRDWVRPSGKEWFENRRALFLSVVGRLKPGVSLSQAEAQTKAVARQLEQAYPEFNKERTIKLVPAETAKTQGLSGPENERGVQNVSLLLVVAASSILLIACANVANLLLARSTTRHREMAIRLALGANRGRVVAQLLTESVLLALIGGLGGVVLAYWLGDVLLSLLPATPVPLAIDAQPDLRVLVFAFVLALLSGVIFGLAPALQTSRWNLIEGLRERVAVASGGRGRWNLRNLLVIAQIAVSLILLIGSGLFLKSFHQAQAIDPGFRTQNLALLTMDFGLAGYDKPRSLQAARSILEQVQRDPQLKHADLGQWIPLGFGGEGRTIFVEGRDESDQHNRKFANLSAITPGLFETLGVPLMRGRRFNDRDSDPNAPQVGVINETMARQFWPGEEAVGKRFHFFAKDPIEVVGVVRDVKATTLGETPQPMLYIPLREIPEGGVTLFLHTAGPPGPALMNAHRVVRQFDTHIPITYEKTIADHMAFALWPSWMGAILLGSLGLLALVLASMGVYGVMAYSVSQRTRELGIRMALGAQGREVLQLVLRQGMILAAIGLAVGLLVALGSSHLVGALLYGVNPSDPIVFIGVTAILTAAAFVACYLPARRAVRIDPIIALRFE